MTGHEMGNKHLIIITINIFILFFEQILLQPLELGMRWETNIQTGVQT
jgi:hypothetical protein